MSDKRNIPFIDLAAQQERIRDKLEEGFRRVMDHGKYIMGPEVKQIEDQLSAYCGAREVVSCSSGTDALYLALLAMGVGSGDAVFAPAYTFTATAEAIALCGATVVFVDVDPDYYTMAPASLEAAIQSVETEDRLTPRVVIPVDLFGMTAPYDEINGIASAHGLTVLSDAAQSFGATYRDKPVGGLAHVTTTSFFPAKPLGCYGDGGAIFTDDSDLAEIMRSIRVHGRGNSGKYDNVRVGMTARLDTVQAMVLIEKLAIFDDESQRRARIAEAYTARLGNVVGVPGIPPGSTPAWALYTISTERRDALQAALGERGVPSQIYYPKPLHKQRPYADCPVSPSRLDVTDDLSTKLLSLPMHPYLDEDSQAFIIDSIHQFLASPG